MKRLSMFSMMNMDYSSFAIYLGQIIAQYRKERGYSQESFADLIGVHRTYIGCIERAEQNITLKNLIRVADGLDMQLSDLIRDVERKMK